MLNRLIFFVLLLAIFIAGCGKLSPVSGKVTYPDGEPVTIGNVFFATDHYTARGRLQKDGSYKISSVNPGDGVPPGLYKVYLDVAIVSEPPDFKKIKVVDPKYCSPNETPVTCEVKGKTTFDFTVEKPK